MTESTRMIQPGNSPEESEVEAWIGEHAFGYWKKFINLIDRKYPDVFVPEWLYGGKKHGWSLRYKKNKSFCTLIPVKDRFAVLIVFGRDEMQKVAAIEDQLLKPTKVEYEKAPTYHDGKWVLFTVDSDAVMHDMELLLEVKRKPKKEKAI